MNKLKEFFSPKPADFIRLEASSMCQLKCPICSTGNGKNKKGLIGWGYLKFNDFRILLDKNPWIKRIELSNWGEIFLNPEFESIVKYAYEKKVILKAGNGVNLNTVKENILESLVKYNFRTLSVSLDGATDEIYRKYRVGGNLNSVIDNIKKINEFKQKYNSEYPKLYWQFVVFGHNEHEIPSARNMAESLGMEFRPKLNWDNSFSPIIDREFVRRESCLKVISREEYKNAFKKQYKIPCVQLWKSPQINWDGKLLGCCVNRYSDFGNVFEAGLIETLNNKKYKYAKKMLLGEVKERADIPCVRCSVYKNMKKFKTFAEIKTKIL